MQAYRYRERTMSPGKRWQTTASSALEEVASKLEGSYDRGKMVKELKERKLANTSTSISFGNEKVNYTSDTKDNQKFAKKGISLAERTANLERIKTMKQDLTRTKFTLGDERPTYESTNQMAMSAAEGFAGAGRVGMNTELKEAIKKSSIHFGLEPVQYQSTAHEAMKYMGTVEDRARLKEEVKEMTATLRKHNFTFGDERVVYKTDYEAGYGTVSADAYKESLMKKSKMRGIIEDSRSCHFNLGNDQPEYLSNTHSAFMSAEGRSASDVRAGLERARKMKAELQRTSIVIGDDAEYF